MYLPNWTCQSIFVNPIYEIALDTPLLHLCQLLWKSCHKNELTSWPSISTLMKWSKSDMSFQWTQQWWMAQTFPSSAKKKRNKWNVRRRRDEERFTNSILIFSSPLGTIHIVEVCVKLIHSSYPFELGKFSYIIIQTFLRFFFTVLKLKT